MLACGGYLTPGQLAQIWVAGSDIPQEGTARMAAECTPVAADFLMRLQLDYCAQ